MIKFQKRTIKVLKRDNKCTLQIYKLSVVSNGKTNIISNKNNTISKLKFVIVKIKKKTLYLLFENYTFKKRNRNWKSIIIGSRKVLCARV